MLLLAPGSLLLGRRQAQIRACVGDGSLVDGFEVFDPLLHLGILGMLLFELVGITQQMHPTALMQSLINIVGGVEVTAQHAFKVFAKPRFDDLTATGVMVFVVAQLRRAGTPHIPIDPVFSPPRFIRLHCWTGANLPLEVGQFRFHLCGGPLRQSNDLSTANLEAMQAHQIRLYLSHRQSHHRAQIGYQARDLHPEASLSHHLSAHIYGGLPPRAALATPAVVHHMLRYFDLRWGRQLDHLSAACHTNASQRTCTYWTVLDEVFDGARWGFPTPTVIVFRITLLTLLLPRGLGLDHIGFHEWRGRRLLLFQFLDACLGHS